MSDAVLAALVAMFRADGGRIYTLDLSSGRYVGIARNNRSSDLASFDVRRLRSHSGWGVLEIAAYTGDLQIVDQQSEWRSRDELHSYGSRVVLPVIRQSTVVGLVDLHKNTAGAFAPVLASALDDAEIAMQQLANSYEARSVQRILTKTAEFKVALYADERTTLTNLIKFVGDSSGMQYTALRRLEDDGSLTCIATHGFGAGLPESQLSLNDLHNHYIPFESVIETRDHWVAESLVDSIYDGIRGRRELADVRSFVACPVLIGEDLWGVLSFATAIEYEYSDLEVYSLRALANLAGVALGAVQSADSAASDHYDDGRLMQAVLSNEVVVATRHEMYDQLAVIGSARSAILEVLEPVADANRPEHSRLTRRDVELLVSEARNLDYAHLQMNKVMETIRFAQGELNQDRAPIAVREVWRRALEPFGFRIRRARVGRLSDDEVPEKLTAAGSFDWLRIVFMHLLLNSLDAFERNWEKGRREIVLKLQDRTADRITLRYFDNAGGILGGTLLRRGNVIDGDLKTLIFERYVTSKERGTGLGLASCRAALATMNGSIELVDWRRGVTFDIEVDAWSDD